MKLWIGALTLAMLSGGAVAQSFSPNYENFFGKEDRLSLYSEKANDRFSLNALKIMRDNTLLMSCGPSGKPSTAFVVKTKTGTQIASAAHNLTMAKTHHLDCALGKAKLPEGKASTAFKDDGTKDDAAHDIAIWPNITQREGFEICKTINMSAKYVLVQSWDGTGKLGISPDCKVKAVKDKLITTTCQGHYKSSGAPLLSVSENKICVAGVFNAHSGKLFGYESYAAKFPP